MPQTIYFYTPLNIAALKNYIRELHKGYLLKIQIISQRTVVTIILLVLFGSTIFQSYQSVSTSVAIHDMQLEVTGFSTNIANQYQNVTYEGHLLICNNQTFTIQNSDFYMNGTITVEDTSTLIIWNSKFTTIPSRDAPLGRESIILVNQSNLIITNVTVIFKHPTGNFNCEILVRDNATANITHSIFQNPGYVTSHENSVIHVSNSTLTTTSWSRYSGVATFDNSTAEIENSTMDGVFVWDNSTVSIKDSVVRLVRTGGTTTIDIATSKVDQIETFEPIEEAHAPTIYVEGSTVRRVRVRDASVLLVNSYAGSIEAQGSATVFVGWNLPLFGLVKMPYTWIPYIQLIVVVAIGVVIVVILRVSWRKKRAKKGSHPQSTPNHARVKTFFSLSTIWLSNRKDICRF